VPDYDTELFLMEKGYTNVAGMDECARGNLIFDVYAAAVILDKGFDFSMLNDSKKIVNSKLNSIANIIKENSSWAIATATAKEIDTINILEATKLAMKRAVSLLNDVDYVLVDGNMSIDIDIPYRSIIKGDSKIFSISAASIIAKDKQIIDMERIHTEFPMYGLNNNNGYATKEHMDAIIKYGPCKYHRKTFKRVKEYL
jgi:ribonuclease HII